MSQGLSGKDEEPTIGKSADHATDRASLEPVSLMNGPHAYLAKHIEKLLAGSQTDPTADLPLEVMLGLVERTVFDLERQWPGEFEQNASTDDVMLHLGARGQLALRLLSMWTRQILEERASRREAERAESLLVTLEEWRMADESARVTQERGAEFIEKILSAPVPLRKVQKQIFGKTRGAKDLWVSSMDLLLAQLAKRDEILIAGKHPFKDLLQRWRD